MKKILLLALIIIILSCLTLKARDIDKNAAVKAANSLIYGKNKLSKATSILSVKKVNTVTSKNGIALAHIVELSPTGFIVTSTDDNIEPVIAYSYKGDFDYSPSEENHLLYMLKQDMELRMQCIPITEKSIIERNNQNWNEILNNSSSINDNNFQQWPAEGTTLTGGWISTTWEQGPPYNDFCPRDLTQPGNPRSVVGCTATAWAQIINYYQPVSGLELNSLDRYSTRNYKINIDSDSAKYDYPSFQRLNPILKEIKNKYSLNQKLSSEEIAALNFFVGIQSEMDYTFNGSGATLFSLPDKGKSGFLTYKSYYGFAQSDWTDYYPNLKSNMMNGLPAILGVTSVTYCRPFHAIICDGYNTNDFYHLNFGWGANSPENVSVAWYKLPYGMPDNYNVISESIVNLTSDKKTIYPIQVSRSNILFGGIKVNTVSGIIKFLIKNTSADKITVTPAPLNGIFEISANGTDFAQSLNAFSLSAGEEKYFYIRGCPVKAESYYSGWLLEISGTNKYYYMVDFNLQGINEAGTIILPGEISGTWTKENSPYLITGDVYIRHQDSLIVKPGVKIIMKGHYKFGVPDDSRIDASGTEQDSIIFTAADALAGWLGLDFMAAGFYPNWKPFDDNSLNIKNKLSYCIIERGRSDQEYPQWTGGAIFIRKVQKIDILIDHCTFQNNKAFAGGAIAIQGPFFLDSKIRILNSLITDNTANNGIIYISDIRRENPNNRIEFTNVTFNANQYSPALIVAHMYSYVIFNNCILWNNSPSSILYMGGDNHGITEPDTVEFNYCDIDTSSSMWQCSGEVKGIIKQGPGNIAQNPVFDKTYGNKFYLSAQSPCIDAGNPSSVYYDREDPASANRAMFPAMGTLRNDIGSGGGGVYNGDVPSPVLVGPPDKSDFKPVSTNNYVTFIWKNNPMFLKYSLQVSPNQNFINLAYEDSTISSYSKSVSDLPQGRNYYWRVKGKTKIDTEGPFSKVWTFAAQLGTPDSLTIQIIQGNKLLLSWKDMSNGESGFVVERGQSGVFSAIATLKENQISYIDTTIKQFGLYQYRVKAVTEEMASSYSNIGQISITAADKNVLMLPEYTLMQNYPNPFNPVTIIKYALPVESTVELRVYNSLGETVEKLIKSVQSPGYHEISFNARNISSGVYYYMIEARATDGTKDYREIKKMIILK